MFLCEEKASRAALEQGRADIDRTYKEVEPRQLPSWLFSFFIVSDLPIAMHGQVETNTYRPPRALKESRLRKKTERSLVPQAHSSSAQSSIFNFEVVPNLKRRPARGESRLSQSSNGTSMGGRASREEGPGEGEGEGEGRKKSQPTNPNPNPTTRPAWRAPLTPEPGSASASFDPNDRTYNGSNRDLWKEAKRRQKMKMGKKMKMKGTPVRLGDVSSDAWLVIVGSLGVFVHLTVWFGVGWMGRMVLAAVGYRVLWWWWLGV
ncbi:hypothetical protein DFH27DRAFT_621579 [Peziza echinospora]|nr:hypothetical protein DFH27DRAFT_621579 [Peziza echinospora]